MPEQKHPPRGNMRGMRYEHHEFIDDYPKQADAEAEVKELEARRDEVERELVEIEAEDAVRLQAEELERQIEQLEAELEEKKRSRKEWTNG